MKITLPSGSAAYCATILIWSTTPFTIHLSNDSLSPQAAVFMRIALATVLAGLIARLCFKQRAFQRPYLPFYAAASIAIFPNMAFVYMAAQYIPSGLISVLFASAPFYIGLIRAVAFRQNTFNKSQLLALLLAIAAMFIIFRDQIKLNDKASYGLMLMMLSNFCFAASNVALKHLNETRSLQPHAFLNAYGSMAMALPGLFLCWLLLDGQAISFSAQSLVGTLYLAIVGSLIGFAAYYASVRQMSITAIAIVPLISPVFALWIGASFNDEAITKGLLSGSLLILLALLLYEGNFLKLILTQTQRRLKKS